MSYLFTKLPEIATCICLPKACSHVLLIYLLVSYLESTYPMGVMNLLAGASHYDIYVRFGRNEQEIENIVSTSHTILDLEAGSEYVMQVVAVSWAGIRSDRSLRIVQTTG